MFSCSAKLLQLAKKSVGAAVGLQSKHNTKSLSTAASANVQTKEVAFVRLNTLQDNPGAAKKKRRVGRGIGSSKGKTCGKGHKGQLARNRSGIPTGFEGGQTKFWKLLPKKGFSNKRHRQKHGADMVILNLGTIQDYIDMGRFQQINKSSRGSIDDNEKAILTEIPSHDAATLGIADFVHAGILKKTPSLLGVKLLAKGKERFSSPVRLVVNRASKQAIVHAEKVGGQVATMHYNRLAIRALILPDKFPTKTPSADEEKVDPECFLPKHARPPPILQPYYTSWKNRGYLCPQVQMREWLRSRPDLKELFKKSLERSLEEERKGVRMKKAKVFAPAGGLSKR